MQSDASAVVTFEAIADILVRLLYSFPDHSLTAPTQWAEQECPVAGKFSR